MPRCIFRQNAHAVPATRLSLADESGGCIRVGCCCAMRQAGGRLWADIDHAWVWRDGGSYYGVPTSNFFGWFLTVYIFYQLFALYLRNRPTIPSRTSHWRLAILFYAASAAGNLLVAGPLSLGGVFVDTAGKRWMIPDIIWASRLVAIFLMMPLALIAWVKAARLVEPARLKKARAVGSL